MKKNLSLVLIIVLAFSILLAACSSGPATPTPTNPNDIIGTWINDETKVEWTYGLDGSLSSTTRVIAKYTYDGVTATITNYDGKVIKPQISVVGDKLIETAGDGTVTYFTKKKE